MDKVKDITLKENQTIKDLMNQFSEAGGFTAKKLGRRCVDNKTTSFVGYEDDFVFYYDHNKITRPFNDNIANPCLDSTTQFPVSLIKGNTGVY